MGKECRNYFHLVIVTRKKCFSGFHGSCCLQDDRISSMQMLKWFTEWFVSRLHGRCHVISRYGIQEGKVAFSLGIVLYGELYIWRLLT